MASDKHQPSNKAAWLTSAKATPLEVKSATYTSPGNHEIVIRTKAVAINPVDWLKQQIGDLAFEHIKYPFILGIDVAGEVVEIGGAVSRFQVGDRVVGHAGGMNPERNKSSESGFQLYTVLLEHMTSPIPSTVTFESASVIPLGLSTAACGLFQKDQLALQPPTVPASSTTPQKTLLIWGGSTSVGCNAIQLAVAAGYEVITTCSPKNFDLVKQLGASQVFDYNSRTITQDLIHVLRNKIVAGALAIGQGSGDACMDIIGYCKGNKFISMANYPIPQQLPERFVVSRMAVHMLSWYISAWIKCKIRGISKNFIYGSTLFENEVGPAVYEDFLPRALAEGGFICAPEPMVVGEGLENIQKAFDVQKKGVSAKKVVVSL